MSYTIHKSPVMNAEKLTFNAIMHIILHGHFIYLQPLQISTICYNPTMKKEIYKRIALFAAMVSMLITFCASCGVFAIGVGPRRDLY